MDGSIRLAPDDVDQRSCQLLGPTALVVQGLMAVLVLLSLVYKRNRETPKRPWRIWLFDVSKQVVGQMFVHTANVFVSSFVSHRTSSNACVFYFLHILLDTAAGVAIIYVILRFLTVFFSVKLALKGFESGVYGIPPSINYWGRQAALYVLSLTTMKMLVVGFLLLFPVMLKLGQWLLSWTYTKDGDALQVVFTVGVFPIVMNILQFWLIDSVVKASAIISSAGDLEFVCPDHEPLFEGNPDDDDEFCTVPESENQRSHPHSLTLHDDSDNKRSPPRSIVSRDQKSPRSTISAGEMHSYPPSLPDAAYDAAVNKAGGVEYNIKRKHRRRSPPPPLHITANFQPAVNSPQLSTAAMRKHTPRVIKSSPIPISATTQDNERSASWQDADDWTSRTICPAPSS